MTTPPGSNDDGTTNKNGNVRRHDQELRDVREVQRDLWKALTSNRDDNIAAHAKMGDAAEANFHRLSTKVDEVKEIASDLRGDSKGGKWVALVLRWVGGATIGGIIASVIWVGVRLIAMESKQNGDAKYGFQLAEGLRRDIDTNEKDIQSLEQWHRLPRNTNTIGPRPKE